MNSPYRLTQENRRGYEVTSEGLYCHDCQKLVKRHPLGESWHPAAEAHEKSPRHRVNAAKSLRKNRPSVRSRLTRRPRGTYGNAVPRDAHSDATCETTPRHLWVHNVQVAVARALGPSFDLSPIKRGGALYERLMTACAMGEPVWMVADEMVLRLRQTRLHAQSWEEQARRATKARYTR